MEYERYVKLWNRRAKKQKEEEEEEEADPERDFPEPIYLGTDEDGHPDLGL